MAQPERAFEVKEEVSRWLTLATHTASGAQRDWALYGAFALYYGSEGTRSLQDALAESHRLMLTAGQG